MIHLEPRILPEVELNAPSKACKMSLLDGPLIARGGGAEYVYGISIQLDSPENPISIETKLKDYSAQLSNCDSTHVCRLVKPFTDSSSNESTLLAGAWMICS